jgi:putative serine protease PepD
MVERVSPGVVNISSTTIIHSSSYGMDAYFQLFLIPRERKQTSLGSGFLIDKDGYVITNHHVVAHADEVMVTLGDKRQFKARIVGKDEKMDLALIQIRDKNGQVPSDVRPVTLGDSDQVRIAETAVAVGNPFGLQNTVTRGIISAKNRAVTSGTGTSESSFINALQTDAAINPGNSGGPLVDATGAVVGVNSAIATLSSSYGRQSGSIGLGFAIPINQAKKTAEQLINNGKATYPIMGIMVDTAFNGAGAKISELAGSVVVGGPAAKVGLIPGDVILKIDGVAINSSDELVVAIRSHDVGDVISVTYTRDGKVSTVKITLVAAKTS